MENRTKIRLTKLEETGNASFPNNIPIGTTRVGFPISKVQVGHPFLMSTERDFGGFITSPIVEILDSQTFKTANSIYRIDII